MVTCEAVYYACSESSWGRSLIEAPTTSLVACLTTHSYEDMPQYAPQLEFLFEQQPNFQCFMFQILR
jgi:hypothetical protein